MYVQPNTQTLEFSPVEAFPDATRAELETTAHDLVRMGSELALEGKPYGGVLLQAGATLQIVAFYTFGPVSQVPAQIRRELRRARRMQRALRATFRIVTACLVFLLSACGDVRELARPELSEPPTVELEPTGELEQDAPATLEPGNASAPVDAIDVLELDGAACTGHWLENDDVGTRLQAHPDSGVCTLPCQIVGPQRNTCSAEHRVHLAELCAELGGACTRASDGFDYCEAL